MLTDLVFLNGHAIEEVLNSYDRSIGIWYLAKNIDLIALSKLGELLGAADYSVLMNGFNPATEPDEQMILNFPQELQAVLKGLSNEQIESVIAPWSEIQEFWGNMSPEDCKKYLIEVREFLNKSDEPVYLYFGA